MDSDFNDLGRTGTIATNLKVTPFYVIIEADDYLEPLLREALTSNLPSSAYSIIPAITHLPDVDSPLLQIRSYESIDFSHLLAHPKTSLANAYVIRKALIRKHYLWQTISSWWVKHPFDTTLKDHVPLTVNFELDYAEFLDEALQECWELKESFEKEEREWWVLKPGMSDQGQGVRLFSGEEELKAIFEEWEAEEASEVNEEGTETPVTVDGEARIGAGTMISQLRHFVAQKYIERPLVFFEHGSRKFHIRSYVLALGALKVYVYRDMLALFAPLPYTAPNSTESSIDAQVHLTNTCLQSGTPMEGSVHRFWELPSSSNTHSPQPEDWKTKTFDHISAMTSTLFEAAAREQMIHFQTLPNAFEVFGIDWMVDDVGTVWLLEVNAFPDFRQSGERLKTLVGDFWKDVLQTAVRDFFDAGDSQEAARRGELIKVLDLDLGRW